MTRFDEALRDFAQSNEQQMGARVGSVGNRYATVQEVGRGRTKRLALQSVAALAAVVVVGAGTWVAVGQFRDAAPAGPAVSDLRYLGDPSEISKSLITCGVPLPVDVDQKVTTASGSQEVPKLTQSVTLTDAEGTRVLDVSPGATTVLSENGVGVASEATWKGEAPKYWGLTNFGVLVDAEGNVVARTAEVQAWNADTGEVTPAADSFVMNSCTDYSEDGGVTGPEFLNGAYRLHIVTQMWVDSPRRPAVQWVDAGLPEGAELTFDWEGYLALQREQEQAADDQFQQLKAVIAESDTTLATLDGTGVFPRANACALAAELAVGGPASVAAVPAQVPTAPVTWTTRGFSWTFADAASDPGWDGSYDYAMVFVEVGGDPVAVSYARPHSTVNGPDGTTSTAWWINDKYLGDCDAPLGLPTNPGTYNAFLVVTSPALDDTSLPQQLRELGGFANLSTWIPVGTYDVP